MKTGRPEDALGNSPFQVRCPTCGDKLREGEDEFDCFCELVRRRVKAMTADVRNAVLLPAHLNHPIMRRWNRSVYFTATLPDMRAFVKGIMFGQPKLFVRVVSEHDLKDVYVGARSKSQRSTDYEGEILNSLEDIMGPPDLVVVKLGTLTNNNRAAQGFLEQALGLRLDYDKPTWAFSDVSSPFQRGKVTWSESVDDILNTSCERMFVQRITPTQDASSPPTVSVPSSPPMSLKTPSAAATGPTSLLDIGGAAPSPGAEGVRGKTPRPLREEKPRVRSSRRPDESDDGVPDFLKGFGSGIAQSRRGKGD
jgi:hypothetical protein